jgi:hypothetical protein
LVAGDLIVVRLAYEGANRDNAVGVGVVEGSVGGEELAPFASVVLIIREHGKVGALAGVPGKRRSDQAAVVGCEVGLSVTVANESKQAVAEEPIAIEKACSVEGSLATIVGAELAFDHGAAFGDGAFCDLIDEAAGRKLAIEDGARAFYNLDGFQLKRIEFAGKRIEAHAVAKDAEGLCVEAADLEPIEAWFDTVLIGLNSRTITQRFVHGNDSARLHLLLTDDRDGLWNLDQQCVGLRSGVRGIGNEAAVGGDIHSVGSGAYVHLYREGSAEGKLNFECLWCEARSTGLKTVVATAKTDRSSSIGAGDTCHNRRSTTNFKLRPAHQGTCLIDDLDVQIHKGSGRRDETGRVGRLVCVDGRSGGGSRQNTKA